jgi:hypothetical protein
MMFTQNRFIFRDIVFVLALLTLASCARTQGRKDAGYFPTYEEIRGNKAETVDFVAPRTLSNGYVAPPSAIVKLDKYWNAFNYPADSTTYYLNGRKAKSQKTARKELDQQPTVVKRVMIGAVAADGTREIEIDYHVKPPSKD